MQQSSKKAFGIILAFGLMLGFAPGCAPAESGARQDGCGGGATPIHAIQGNGERTPLANERHVIEGVVVGDYQNTQFEFGGFFVQEEDADTDGDPGTSEAIFVYDNGFGVEVQPGDVVRVEGSVLEFATDGAPLTELRRIQSLTVCSRGAAVTPVEVTLPMTDLSDWERYEGMLVTLPQTLTATEVYNLGRYGEVVLTEGGRLFVGTQIAEPGTAANRIGLTNGLRTIILDDASDAQNIDPTRYPAQGLSAANTLRAGDTVTGLTGVLDQRYGTYRIQPVGPVNFTPGNPRPAQPEAVGGDVRVATFNVLNYFNGNGQGGGFPTERGADTSDEWERQRAKLISALTALDADVIGLLEIENDGSGADSALADLVRGLNEAGTAGTYAYVSDPAGWRLPGDGADAIKVALIYRPAAVVPVGDPATTFEAPFGQRRPPIAQTFEDAARGERFTITVNHFKSKGCDGARGADSDQGDGQDCFNAERVQAAEALLAWLATDPTGSGDPDVLIVGDLNSYAQEDPISRLRAGGYTNLVAQFAGENAYSYIYFGEAGTLDYALASSTLAPQVVGAAVWHINADEPPALDYNVEYKTPGQVTSFYRPDPFRSSDHDPLIVGLDLGG
ncbi:MAG: ExeM/NucH family extracellular endonuclease [Chloroflexi bacterium]|nr:ExeM/NucH family extracellular endonuclease [Chloroflexota bacterium]